MRRSRLVSIVVAAMGVAMLLLGSAGGAPRQRSQTGSSLRAMPFPQSVSFVSSSTGWVWGPTAWPTTRPQPGLLAHTADGGRTWRELATPGLDWSAPAGGAARVHFADARRGYLYGPALWYTPDGGRRWQRVRAPAPVVDVEGSAGAVFALIVPGRSDSSPLSAVYVERLAGSRLQRLLTVASSSSTSLVVRGSSLFLLASQLGAGGRLAPAALWVSRDRGRSWVRRSAPCMWSGDDGFALAAWAPGGLALACGSSPGAGSQSKSFYASSDGGRTWHYSGARPMDAGYVGYLVALNSGTWVLSSVRDPALEITHDGGRSWASPSSTAFSGEWWGPLSVFGRAEIAAAPGTLNGHELAFGMDGARDWQAVAVKVATGR